MEFATPDSSYEPCADERLIEMSFKKAQLTELSIQDTIDRITSLNHGIANFWMKSSGWAPIAAAGLLGKSRLDWQTSLSQSLSLWIRTPANSLTAAELILAWANLGSLVEGTIKTLLSVWYETYEIDIDDLKKANLYNYTKQEPHSPDGVTLEKLKQYCKLKNLLDAADELFVELVQQRRNAIHAFKDRPIGDGSEFQSAVRSYLVFLRKINERLPYPDDVYAAREF